MPYEKMGSEEQVCKILQLSDCTMMCILSYLDATSLFNLSRTCLYFKNIVEDSRLWRYIDARQEPNSTKKVQYVCDRIYDRTSHLFLKAESKYNGLLKQNLLLEWNRLEHLVVLALENQRFDGRSLTLREFPKTLQELSLRKTHLKNGKSFFQYSFDTMRNLRVLILDECDWLDSNFFMSVAKYENLEILSIVKCMKLHLNVVPYLNVAKYGCKKMKVIDCRFSTVANEVLTHLQRFMLALYSQSMRSYELDTGRPLIKCPPMTADCQDLIAQSLIRDRTLYEYQYMTGSVVEELPCSLLYQDPYPECSCGWKEKGSDDDYLKELQLKEEACSMSIDDYIDFNISHQRFICRRHVRELTKLPEEFKNFFYQNQKKFYPDSSDNDSDSDDDRECCMFGVESQQMIVLKVREADYQGNLPEPEVIDIVRPGSSVININIRLNPDNAQPAARSPEDDPQPSTSSSSSEPSTSTAKRKNEDDSEGSQKKRARTDEVDPCSTQSANSSRPEDVRRQQVFRIGPVVPEPLGGRLVHNFKQRQEQPPTLRRLSLRGYREVTDKGLLHIQNLGLNLLDVTHTTVTKEGIEAFLLVNPNCRVVHPNYCVCKPRIPC